jgi:hypothetical protein
VGRYNSNVFGTFSNGNQEAKIACDRIAAFLLSPELVDSRNTSQHAHLGVKVKKATVVVGDDIVNNDVELEANDDDSVLLQDEKSGKQVQLHEGFVLRNLDFEAKPGTVC